MAKPFIPERFEPPQLFDSEHFHFRGLEEDVAQLDFEAVMSSQQRLQGIFGPESDWPRSNMTLEENTEDLKVHRQESESRVAFAYSVFNNSKEKCLGSVYIDPSHSPEYDCTVHFWIREDSIGLDKELYQTISNWLQTVWPFSKISFPGRSLENSLK